MKKPESLGPNLGHSRLRSWVPRTLAKSTLAGNCRSSNPGVFARPRMGAFVFCSFPSEGFDDRWAASGELLVLCAGLRGKNRPLSPLGVRAACNSRKPSVLTPRMAFVRQRQESATRVRFYVDKLSPARLSRVGSYRRSALISRDNLGTSFWPSQWKQDPRRLIPSNRSEEAIPHFQFADVASINSGQLRYRKISEFSHKAPSYTLERPMSSDHEDGFGGSVGALEIHKEAIDRIKINILFRLPVRYRPYTAPIPVEEITGPKTTNHFNIGEAFPVAIIYLSESRVGDGRSPCTRGRQSDLCISACSSQRTAKSSGWYAPCAPQCRPESPGLTFPFQDEGRIGLATCPYRFRAGWKSISVSRENNLHGLENSVEGLIHLYRFFLPLHVKFSLTFLLNLWIKRGFTIYGEHCAPA